jgi:hypothetical protein
MKHIIHRMGPTLGQVDQHRVRLALAVLTLVLFVLGGGAPAMGGGSNGGG